MLWLNRPRASRDMGVEIVNDDGLTVAQVFVSTDDEEVLITLRRIEDDPRVCFIVP